MRPEENQFWPVYSEWIGKPVLLLVVRECRVPIPCSIVAEFVDDVRVQLQPGWEFDIPKDLILAVEEAGRTPLCCN
jgi:hypothetical protein